MGHYIQLIAPQVRIGSKQESVSNSSHSIQKVSVSAHCIVELFLCFSADHAIQFWHILFFEDLIIFVWCPSHAACQIDNTLQALLCLDDYTHLIVVV